MKELDEFIGQFDPESPSFSLPDPRQSLEDEELFESALELTAHEHGEPLDDRLGELIARLDEEHGEEAVRSAIVDYYGGEQSTEFAEATGVRDSTRMPDESRVTSWGYVQTVAFSFVTASYLLDDYLERNDLQTAYTEAQRRSWLLLLALALLKFAR